MTGLRDALRDVDRMQPLFGMQTMNQVLGQSLSRRRFLMLLIGMFAGMALLLGLVGTLFGVSQFDPLTYVLAPALLFTVVVGTSSLPALRATRVPSIGALSGE